MVAPLPSKGPPLITLKFTPLAALLAAAVALANPGRCAAEDNCASLALRNAFLLGNDGGGYSSGIFGSALRVASPGEGGMAGVAPIWLFASVGNWLGVAYSTPRWSPTVARASASALVESSPARQQYGSLTFANLLS